ncbi:MAG: TolC family protein, partial [Planctomycetota bacterium]
AILQRLRGQRASLDLAYKDFLPDFTVTGAYSSFWQEDDLQPYIGLGLNIPIQTGRRHGAIDESAARIARLKAQLAELAASVALEVQDAFERVVESEHVVELYRTELVPAAEENLEAARSEYTVGKTDFLSLLTAERSLTDAQLELHRAVTSYHQGLADLERVVGARLFPRR